MKDLAIISSRPYMLRRFRFAMSMMGGKTIGAENGAAARALDYSNVGIVYFDVLLDDVSAFSLAKELRESLPALKEVPFVICVFTHDTNVRQYYSSHGFNTVFALPFTRKRLYLQLAKFGLFSKEEARKVGSPVSAFPEQAQLRFLKWVGEKIPPDIRPSYDPFVLCGYHYADIENYFPCDFRDSFAIAMMFHEKGLLERTLRDRIHLCPKCGAHDVNYREICPGCRGIRFVQVDVIHHFLCGYVGEFQEFYHADTREMICPKCNDKLRHIGLDYEKPAKTYKCLDCGNTFLEPAVGCYCPVCDYVFDSDKAIDLDVYSYTLTDKARRCIRRGSLADDRMQEAEEPFCSSIELFRFMLRQNYLECAVTSDLMWLTLFAMPNCTVKLRHDLLGFINEIKRPSSLVAVDQHGFILLQTVRAPGEIVDAGIHKVQGFVLKHPDSKGKRGCFFAERIRPQQQKECGDLLEHFYERFNAVCNGLPEGIFADENEA